MKTRLSLARTGLWLREPFDAHLARMASDHHASGRPISMVVLRVTPAIGAREPSPEVWRKGFSEDRFARRPPHARRR